MKATETRIMIRGERESSTARVLSKKRELGRRCSHEEKRRNRCSYLYVVGLSEVWPWPCPGLYTSIDRAALCEPLSKQRPLGHSENCLKPGCVSVIAGSICSIPEEVVRRGAKEAVHSACTPSAVRGTKSGQTRERQRFVPAVGSACLRAM